MAQLAQQVWRQVIAVIHQPHFGASGGPIVVAYSPEGDTPTQIRAQARHFQDWARAYIRLRASYSGWGATEYGGSGGWSAAGPELMTVSRGPLTYGLTPSNARTGSFSRQVYQISGYDTIVLTLEAESNIAHDYADYWRRYSPRGLLGLQTRR
jgi:hypothetical protein